jgi:hypothetical protein
MKTKRVHDVYSRVYYSKFSSEGFLFYVTDALFYVSITRVYCSTHKGRSVYGFFIV